MPRILLVEDDPLQQELVENALQPHGLEVRPAGTAAAARARLDNADLVILDLGLPDGDGLDLLSELREWHPEVPVVVVSARASVEDRVLGLALGADDYVPKPFDLRELSLRVRAVLKRAGWREHLEVGGLVLRPFEREVSYGGRRLELTRLEFAVLLALARRAGSTVSREQLLSLAWGGIAADINERTVDVRVTAIRRKLKEVTGHPWIKTVWGSGYRLMAPEQARAVS